MNTHVTAASLRPAARARLSMSELSSAGVVA
jgi:hypothetical protein